MFPIDLKKVDNNTLSMVWDDGHEGMYTLEGLRKNCPCATCRSARASKEKNPLKVLSPKEVLPDHLQLVEAETVGRYAIQFRWNDGHDTGIYSFDYLRELCQCDLCAKGEDTT